MNKKYTLKKRHIILNLLSKKETVGTRNYIIYYKETNCDVKVAISVSKKVGNAVERNYQKRVCREIVSKKIKDLNGYSLLLVVKPCAIDLSFDEKEAQINYLIKKIINKKKGELNVKK